MSFCRYLYERNKNMRRIKLTEHQLHNVIRESVSNILNELNWKTYNNAAKKRSQQKLIRGTIS